MRDHLYSTRTRQIAAGNREEMDAWIEERVTALIATGVTPGRRRRALRNSATSPRRSYAVRQDVRRTAVSAPRSGSRSSGPTCGLPSGTLPRADRDRRSC